MFQNMFICIFISGEPIISLLKIKTGVKIFLVDVMLGKAKVIFKYVAHFIYKQSQLYLHLRFPSQIQSLTIKSHERFKLVVVLKFIV